MNKNRKILGFKNYNETNLKLVLNIIPAFMVLFVFFFFLTRHKLMKLSTDSFELMSQNYSARIDKWVGETLNELSIYKDYADKMGLDGEQTKEFFETSYNKFAAFPYGVYWGNCRGEYYDVAGWVPEEDYVSCERDWYIEGLQHEEFAFGEPYFDVYTGGTCISATVRMGSGEDEGVLAADIYLNYFYELTSQIMENDFEAAFLMTKDRKMIAYSDPGMAGKTLADEGNPLLYRNISKCLDGGEDGLVSVRGKDGYYFVDIREIESTGWYFISVMRRKDVLFQLWETEIAMLIATIIASSNLLFVVIKIVNEFSTANRKAKTDPLTKVFNRNGFRESVLLGMEAHPNQGVLMIMDMDNFKLINDQFGHPEGDEVLKKFALMLEEYFNRNKDVVARIGGDEFAVFVGRDITARETESMLKKFMEIFHRTFDGKYPEQKLSVSIGGTFSRDDLKYEELYEKADQVLYRVKKNGKNSFELA